MGADFTNNTRDGAHSAIGKMGIPCVGRREAIAASKWDPARLRPCKGRMQERKELIKSARCLMVWPSVLKTDTDKLDYDGPFSVVVLAGGRCY